MTLVHLSGFPRIGAKRELKTLLEAYWHGECDEAGLARQARELRQRHWLLQRGAGVDRVAVGDFSLYDHVLDNLRLLGALPRRFGFEASALSAAQYFELGRGNATQQAMAMKKWFDTNYHYLVPEWEADMHFHADASPLLEQWREAQALGIPAKPVLIGPLTLLWLGRSLEAGFDRLALLPALTSAYVELLGQLTAAGADWIQIDEPALVLDLPPDWVAAAGESWRALCASPARLMLASYFGPIDAHAGWINALPLAGLHLDLVRAPHQAAAFAANWPAGRVLSAGIIDGRNVWRADLDAVLAQVHALQSTFGTAPWLAPSCSLLHCPYDLAQEIDLAQDIKTWLAFSVQKLNELKTIQRGLQLGAAAIENELAGSRYACETRRRSLRIHLPRVQAQVSALAADAPRRDSPYAQRAALQRERLALPLLPTTTIGSFPQTAAIRETRAAYRQGALGEAAYQEAMRREIASCIARQEAIGLDVLVHGEAERNDMVEYFAAALTGFAHTRLGWVQSYGSRCVKPPILFGDVERPAPITVEWARYAQSLTARPVKGMLTGPVTLLQWSFVRDDLPRAQVCRQIALALNAEILDLEAAGIAVIQVDEPALREGLPLRGDERPAYLDWAVAAFRLACRALADTTQVHTHMCYAEFSDILPAIAALDADVITIETSRSDMQLLEAFGNFSYPNEIGPGVYDIHSPRPPTAAAMRSLLDRARSVIPVERLWVNPDCGLKTRTWAEVEAALRTMVGVVRDVRREWRPA
ncbi:5-methyltetrahydropteroyltriglutamate--homocysteine S-methyltransferase [Paludibacterium yongneupense]|uniref:5-methyltetrahydropteroyltriglutamate-- homocysteine S-methyltransferase n=1 Tax=Paludibacterium yongneupense TaxID=400061 RepID=UPI000402BE66|nr:5-methyltetrahydropteroyltriglutamate--homocysteine S-methyltransferase [Paludibacterium yongneupense]